jgi:hypothetical protein
MLEKLLALASMDLRPWANLNRNFTGNQMVLFAFPAPPAFMLLE